jgi:hypothetical protein
LKRSIRKKKRNQEKSVKVTLQKSAVLRKQDKMATIAVRKGRLYYSVSLIKYQRTLEDNCFVTFRVGTCNVQDAFLHTNLEKHDCKRTYMSRFKGTEKQKNRTVPYK